jgi:hypothetical protein
MYYRLAEGLARLRDEIGATDGKAPREFGRALPLFGDCAIHSEEYAT